MFQQILEQSFSQLLWVYRSFSFIQDSDNNILLWGSWTQQNRDSLWNKTNLSTKSSHNNSPWSLKVCLMFYFHYLYVLLGLIIIHDIAHILRGNLWKLWERNISMVPRIMPKTLKTETRWCPWGQRKNMGIGWHYLTSTNLVDRDLLNS